MARLQVVYSYFVLYFASFNCEIYQDRPKIKTADGDLILEPAYGRSIYLRPNGPKSGVFVGNKNVLTDSDVKVIQDVPSQTNDQDSNSASGIPRRLDIIESYTADIREELYSNISALWRKIDILNRKVRDLTTELNVRTLDSCNIAPCHNGGTCLNIANGYKCLCPSNWEGQDCDVDFNECLNYADTGLGCQNRAECINTPGSFECRCKPGWYGIHCTRKIRDCFQGDYEMCGHGTCYSDSTKAGIACMCNQGWTTNGTSDECLTDVNECNSNQGPRCSVNPKVECINLPGSFECGPCPQGYHGDGFTCSDVDECVTIPNGGCSPLVTCHNIIGSVMCGLCPPGYLGDGKTCTWRGTCNIDHGGCHPSAQCIQNLSIGQTAQCVCPEGMDGDGIGIHGCYVSSGDTQSCANHPCGSHGQCHQLRTGYTCICQRGYGGSDCRSTSACIPNPCHNSGLCRIDDSFTAGFRCECTAQYSGPLCDMRSKTCGGVLAAEEGSIIYPLTNTTYDHNSRCAWVIRTVPEKVINVTFSKFSVEETSGCLYDFLQIHDGRSAASLLIGKFCGSSLPNIISSHNELYFWFRSDSTVAKDGFTLHWTSVDPVCGGEVDTTSHGRISSPGSPGPYPPNRDCYWHLKTDFSKRFNILFFSLDIQNNPNCSLDFLAIYDGAKTSDPLLNKYCNSSQPAPLQSAGSELMIHFHSGASGTGKGFQLSYAPIPGVPGCGGYFTSEVGEISSPSYNGSYLPNMLCQYRIQTSPDTKIRIHFKQFQLEEYRGCLFDYLKIYDGPNSESPLVGKFCGTTHPDFYLSSSNTMFFLFRSDLALSGAGFTILYQALCKVDVQGDSGVIKSPGYPFRYPLNRVCEYVISTSPGKAIQLTFQDFDVEQNPNRGCEYDNVEVRDGMDANAPLLGKYCADSGDTPPEQLSTLNYMYIRFKSDENLSGTGFYANYTTVDVKCGGIHRETTGIITHQLSSDGSLYEDQLTCLWILVAPVGHHIQVIWNRLDLEDSINKECVIDYVKLTEIDDNNKYIDIGTFCGRKTPPTSSTLSNRLMVKLNSNILSDSLSGFSLNYTFLDDVSYCNGSYFRSHGLIYSPGWPRQYKPNLSCTWVITVPAGQQIRLNISQFDLESTFINECDYGDYLELRNGAAPRSPLIGRYCGHFNYKIVKSFSSSMHIHFRSDRYLAGAGFQLEWDSSISGCGGTMTSSSGSISSPNYPESYNENTECFYRIVTNIGNRIHMRFSELELERSPFCLGGYVEIFDGKDSSSPSLGRYCSMAAGFNNIKTTSNNAFIKFRSDYFNSGKGFLINYDTVCNNNITGKHGAIETPDYPYNYPKHLDCSWTINVPKGNKINVTFTSFDVSSDHYFRPGPYWLNELGVRHSMSHHGLFTFPSEPYFTRSSGFCASSYVQWKEPSVATYSDKFCGTELPPTISTRSNSLQIKFSSSVYSAGGFRLEWISYGCGGYIQKRSGYISLDRNNTSTDEMDCEWLIETPSGTSIRLEISELYVTENQNCTSDVLEIYNGQDINAPIIAELCNRERSVIRTTSNFALIRFVKNSLLKAAYFTLNFRAAKPTCGSVMIATSGYIYSKNYPKNYDPNMNCIWTIAVPVNHRIEFNIIDLDLYSTPGLLGSSSNCGDSIQIYDYQQFSRDQNSTLLICPGSNTKQFIAKNHIISVQFKSDQVGNAKGFKANFRMTCGASITADRDGVVSNRAYIGRECSWTIKAPKLDQKISLTITQLQIPNNGYRSNGSNCWPSYLRVHDGDDTSAPIIDEYCGRRAPAMIVSHGSAITLLVGSYNNNTVDGQFSAHYSSLNEACGGTLTSEEGFIASPNYPKPYPIGSNCEWTLRTSPGNKVYVTFELFDLEYSDRCNDDYLEIRENNAIGQLLGVYCGTDVPLKTTTANILYIKFHSNEDIGGKGFLLRYGFLYGNEIINKEFGEIASPLYPNLYRGDASFSWGILSTGSDPIRLTIDKLEISSYGNVCHNALFVYDGLDDTAPLLSRLCGVISNPVKVLETTSNAAFIKLSLDLANTGASFHLTWNKNVLNLDNADTGKINCGSNTTVLLGYGGTSAFTSPYYPNNYGNELNCEWIFRAPKGRHLQLHFQSFMLEENDNCFDDFVNIYSADTPGQWKPLKEHVCTRQLAMQDANAGSYLKVTLVTDSSRTATGFQGEVRSVCGGSFTDLSGEVMPSWQEFNAANMMQPLNCQWSVKVRPGRLIKLRFTHFNITKTDGKCATSVALRNGETAEAPLLPSGTYCGDSHENRENIVTSSNALHVSYTTDFHEYINREFKAFGIHYEEKNVECGATSTLDLYQSWEVISSPNYPDTADPYSECVWIYTAPPGESLRVDFIGRFDLDNVDGCVNEFIELRDGTSSSAPLIKRFCGAPGTVTSSSNAIYINYVTLLSAPRNGFQANVSISYCGGTLIGDSGEITSPGYPDVSNMAYNSVCEWRVKGPFRHVFNIHVQEMDMPMSVTKCGINVTVENILETNNVTILKVFCSDENNALSTSIETVTNEFVVKYSFGIQSSPPAGPVHKGFRFTFHSSRPKCGGDVNTPEGYLTTPGYPMDTTLVDCYWYIKVPDKTKRIKLELIDVDITKQTIFFIEEDDAFLYENDRNVYESTGNYMFFGVVSRDLTHRFKAKFSSNEPALCGGDIYGLNGEITSPNIQRAYKCQWHYFNGDDTYKTTLVTVKTNSSAAKTSCNYNSDTKLIIKSITIARYVCGTNETSFRMSYSDVNNIIATKSRTESFDFKITLKSQRCGGTIQIEDETPRNILDISNVTGAAIDCAWVVNTPNGAELTMEGYFQHNCDNEFLQIYSPGYRTLEYYCESKPFDNSIVTRFTGIFVEYHSINFNSSSIKLMAKSVWEQEICGGDLSKYQNVFKSPNYPKSHESNQECTWTMTADVGERISLSFIDRFLVEDQPNCTKDAVIVYDWKDDTYQEIARLCGRPTLLSYNSTYNKMKVIFRTDNSTNLDGFKATWTAICGGDYLATDTKQIMYSPRFPNDYNPSSDCTYTISAPTNKKVTVEFEEFNLEGTYPDCLFDNVTVTAEVGERHLFEVYCGGNVPPIIANTNKVSIIFKSDKYDEMKGFKFSYQISECGGTVNATSIISSHRGDTYDSHMNCSWFIQAPDNKVVVLRFLYIDLLAVRACHRDYVAVYNDFEINEDKRMALICGHVNSTVLRSNSSKVLMNFVTDSHNLNGFKVHVLFSYTESVGCGGHIDMSLSEMTLTSFHLGNSVVYENDIDCVWRITSPLGTQIKIAFDSFHIAPCSNVLNQTAIGYKCDCDYVEILDGINPESLVMGTYCGHTLPAQVMSSSNVMSVRLATDGESVSSGFEARLSVQQSQCGPSSFILGESVTRIKSPGFERGSITRGIHCIYHFHAKYPFAITRLLIRHLDLRPAVVIGNIKKCDHDKLLLTSNSAYINRTIGKDYIMNYVTDRFIRNNLDRDNVSPRELHFCGSTIPSEIHLTGSVTVSIITSPESDSITHQGVDFEVSMVNGCDRNYTGTQGKIEFSYNPRNDVKTCYILITAPVNYTISAYFIFVIPDSSDLSIQIYNGNRTSSQKLGSLRKNFETSIPFFSSGRYMLLVNQGYFFFDMNYVATDKGVGCGGKLTNQLGRVTSPLYPNNYRMKASCEWELETPSGTRLKLHFTTFDLGIVCDQNYVQLVDSKGGVVSTYCDETPADYTSSDNYVKIIFHTTVNNGGTGWVADFIGIA